MKQENLNDQELIKKYRNSHDTSYLNGLFKRHLSELSVICFARLKNEDWVLKALQEIYCALQSELKKHELEDVESWFLLQTRVQCRRMMRLYSETSNEELQESYNQSIKELFSTFKEYIPENADSERNDVLIKGIKWLQEEQRTCLEYVHFDHMTLDQIAYINGTSTSEVKHNLHLAEHNLKRYLNRRHEQSAQ
mgnify:CR=1 FL=1